MFPFSEFLFSVNVMHVSFYPVVPSGSPENFSGMSPSSDTIVLTWDLPLMQNRNGIIRDYIINVTALDTEENSQYVTSDRNLTLDSLMPFSTYAFIVAARTAVGAGPFSTVITIRTLEDGKRYNYIYIILQFVEIFTA